MLNLQDQQHPSPPRWHSILFHETGTASNDLISDVMDTEHFRRLQRPMLESNSPSLPAPDSQIPGPRASRLHQVFDQALARTLRANSYANFAGCFPTPARHVPASLENVWRQLNAKLEESAKAEFEEIIAEREAVKNLNALDQLVGEARSRRENDTGKDDQQPRRTYVSFSQFEDGH